MPTLDNQRHEKFAQSLASGMSASDAYVAAGYKESRSCASRLLTNANITSRVAELQEKAAEGVILDRQWVLDRLMENVERAMQTIEVKDSKGVGTGEFKYEGSVANRALELLGKELSMFKEKVEVGGKDGGPIEHKVEVCFVSAKE